MRRDRADRNAKLFRSITKGATLPLGFVGGAGAFGGPAFLQSNVTTLSQLAGPSADFGVSAADGLGVSGDVSVSASGVTTVLSAGFGIGGNGHAAVIQQSQVIPVCQ